MERTNIMVEFRIVGEEDFKPNIATEMLSITPNYTWLKGDKRKNSKFEYEYSCWGISTGYEISFDIYNQLNKIMKLINNKKKELIELKNCYELEYKIDIVIRIENNQTPAVYLNKNEIEFANDINAEFDFDIYVNS